LLIGRTLNPRIACNKNFSIFTSKSADILQFLQVYLFAASKLWTTSNKYMRSLLNMLQESNLVIVKDETNETKSTPLKFFFGVDINRTTTVVEKLRA
jgi:hypothetical protein